MDFQPKIKTMTGSETTVQLSTTEPGGIVAVMLQILMGNISMDLMSLMQMVLIGKSGKDLTTR